MSIEGYDPQEEHHFEEGIDPDQIETLRAFAVGEEGLPAIPAHIEVNDPEELPPEVLQKYRSTNTTP